MSKEREEEEDGVELWKAVSSQLAKAMNTLRFPTYEALFAVPFRSQVGSHNLGPTCHCLLRVLLAPRLARV